MGIELLLKLLKTSEKILIALYTSILFLRFFKIFVIFNIAMNILVQNLNRCSFCRKYSYLITASSFGAFHLNNIYVEIIAMMITLQLC